MGGCPRGKAGWSATGFPLRDAEHQQRARRRVVPRPTIGHRSSHAKAIVGPNRCSRALSWRSSRAVPLRSDECYLADAIMRPTSRPGQKRSSDRPTRRILRAVIDKFQLVARPLRGGSRVRCRAPARRAATRVRATPRWQGRARARASWCGCRAASPRRSQTGPTTPEDGDIGDRGPEYGAGHRGSRRRTARRCAVVGVERTAADADQAPRHDRRRPAMRSAGAPVAAPAAAAAVASGSGGKIASRNCSHAERRHQS